MVQHKLEYIRILTEGWYIHQLPVCRCQFLVETGFEISLKGIYIHFQTAGIIFDALWDFLSRVYSTLKIGHDLIEQIDAGVFI